MDLVQAIDLIYLFRIQGEEGNAWKVAFQTDGTQDETRNYETTPTKDGAKKTAGDYEGSHSLTSLLAKGDEDIRKINNLVRKDNPEKLEVWEIDRSDIAEETTIPGDYSTDVVTSFSKSAGADGNVEVSIETEVEGTIISGDVTVTPELLAILQKISEEQAFVQPIASEEGK